MLSKGNSVVVGFVCSPANPRCWLGLLVRTAFIPRLHRCVTCFSSFFASFGVLLRIRRPCSASCIPCAPYLLPPPLSPSDAVDLMRVSGTSTVSLGEWSSSQCSEPPRALPRPFCLLPWLALPRSGRGLDARQRYFHGRLRRVGLVASVGNVPVLLHPRCRQFERVGVMALLAFFLYPFIWRCRRPRCALRDELRLCW